MKHLLLTLAAITLLPFESSASTVKMNPKRTVEIIGAVNMEIIEKAKQVNKLSKESKEDIFLLINSPGGSVAAGNVFIASMIMAKSRGVKVKCVVPIYAASMAFSIMLNCSKNYVLEKTSLLFHPVRIGLMGYLTAQDAYQIYLDLIKIDIQLLDTLYERLGAVTNEKKEELYHYYLAEKWWSAIELKEFVGNKSFLTIVKNIEGSDKIFDLSPSQHHNDKKILH